MSGIYLVLRGITSRKLVKGCHEQQKIQPLPSKRELHVNGRPVSFPNNRNIWRVSECKICIVCTHQTRGCSCQHQVIFILFFFFSVLHFTVSVLKSMNKNIEQA